MNGLVPKDKECDGVLVFIGVAFDMNDLQRAQAAILQRVVGWLLVVGCWLLCCWLLVVVLLCCWLLVVGCWLLVVGCWLLCCCVVVLLVGLLYGFSSQSLTYNQQLQQHNHQTKQTTRPTRTWMMPIWDSEVWIHEIDFEMR